MRLLLISNSTMAGEAYLEYPKQTIKSFLGEKPVNAVFIPYAAVSFAYDEYVDKVNRRFNEIGHSVVGIHTFADQVGTIRSAEAVVVGGGNTWHLLRKMRDYNLLSIIRERVVDGMPYIGWSAGSNVACPTIKTTNDMPIVDPLGFDALNLLPFQINPHYLDAIPDGHAGETREERIEEFLVANPGTYVVGLREGSMLMLENKVLVLEGEKTMRIFKNGLVTKELRKGDDLSFLI